MSEDRKLRVFLCHSSNDKPAVRELYKQLKAEGWIDVWLDEEKLYPGQDWNYEIEKAVEDADAILVCLTKGSVTKEGYVQRELRKVLEEAETVPEGTIFIIPVRLDDCEIPRHLRTWQYANYFPPSERDKAYERLIVSLRNRAVTLGITTADSKSTSEELSQVKTQTKARLFATPVKAWFEKRRLQNLISQFNKFVYNRTWLLLLPMILLCVSSVLFRWPSFIFQEPTQTGTFITTEVPTEFTTKAPIKTELPSTEPSPTEPSPTEPSPTEPSPTEPSPTEPSPTDSPTPSCNTRMPSRLGSAEKAVVVRKTYVRDTARFGSAIIKILDEGDEVQILDAPVCETFPKEEDYDYLWWPILYQDIITGWVSEMPRNEGDYLLQPAP